MPRPITDYSKVQTLVSSLVRGREWLQPPAPKRQYLNVGCGPFPHPEFINVDYRWRPSVQLCWDITRPTPLEDESLLGIYTEHCLQDIPLKACRFVLRESWRLLKPDGTVRFVLPDIELYLDLYHKHRAGESVQFPYPEPGNPDLVTPVMNLNRAFRHNGELHFAYDFETLAHLCREAGFSQVNRATFGQGRDPMLLLDHAYRAIESFYAEAIK